TDGIVTVDRGVPGKERLRQLHRTGRDDLEVLGSAAPGRRQSTGGNLDDTGRRQRSEPECLSETLPRAAGLHTSSQVESFDRGSPRFGAHGVEEFTTLPMADRKRTRLKSSH